MKACPNCGFAHIPDVALFCPMCATPTASAAPPAKTEGSTSFSSTTELPELDPALANAEPTPEVDLLQGSSDIPLPRADAPKPPSRSRAKKFVTTQKMPYPVGQPPKTAKSDTSTLGKKRDSFSVTLQLPNEGIHAQDTSQATAEQGPKKNKSFSITLSMPNALAKKGVLAETINLPAGGQKKLSFSETLWFKKGAEGDDLVIDSDFELERTDLQARYEPDLKPAAPEDTLDEFSLNRRR